jgi:hypothetical protein
MRERGSGTQFDLLNVRATFITYMKVVFTREMMCMAMTQPCRHLA